MSSPIDASKKFPDFVPPTKVHYIGGAPTLRLRSCTLSYEVDGQPIERTFEQGEVRIGAMDDNDIVITDDTVSRYHCRIVQEDSGYVVVDLASTNGSFVNRVRVREAFLKPGCTLHLGHSELRFQAGEAEVEIIPSRKDRCGDLIGRHAKLRELYALIERIAPTSTTVVIEGETGTGKEVVAQTLHKLSPRAAGPIMVFDCGAVPENLIESELFGHEKGSFTGAIMTRQGIFELADGGTLFLDELGELPLELQPKLLRVLEQREIRRVGSHRPIKVDVRIIAATNRKLEDEVRAGRFRQDLYYRLSVVRLELPPLRERGDDVTLLAKHFLRSHTANRTAEGTIRLRGISREALEALETYRWPGNVRELLNTIERGLSFAEGDTLELADLPEQVRDAVRLRPTATNLAALAAAPAPEPTKQTLLAPDTTFKESKERWISGFERDYIIALLRKNGGNISHSAREADIDRKYFRKLMKKYELEASGGEVAPDDDDDGTGGADGT